MFTTEIVNPLFEVVQWLRTSSTFDHNCYGVMDQDVW